MQFKFPSSYEKFSILMFFIATSIYITPASVLAKPIDVTGKMEKLTPEETGYPFLCVRDGDKVMSGRINKKVRKFIPFKPNPEQKLELKKINRILSKLLNIETNKELNKKQKAKQERLSKKALLLSAKKRKEACTAAFKKKDGEGGGGGGGGGNPPPPAPKVYWQESSGSFGIREARILHERFAFGASMDTLKACVQAGRAACVEGLLTWKSEPTLATQFEDIKCDSCFPLQDLNCTNRECNNLNPYDFDQNGLERAIYWTFYKTQNPFFYQFLTFIHRERATAQSDTLPFNRRHFAPMHWDFLVNVAKRLDYAWFIKNVSEDPLLAYFNLNLGENFALNGKEPNEDYARELVELISMSPTSSELTPNYNTLDIISIAQAFSGRGYVTINVPIGGNNTVSVVYPAVVPTGQIPGPKPLFINTPYETTIDTAADAIDAILGHPETYYHFAYEIIKEYITLDIDSKIDKDAIWQIADLIATGEGDLKPVFRKLMLSAELYSSEFEKSIPRSPIERLIGLLRSLGDFPVLYSQFPTWFSNAGMRIMQPGNVSAGRVFGWDNLTLIGSRIIEFRNIINGLLSTNPNTIRERGYNIDSSIISHLDTNLAPSTALVTMFNDLYGLGLSTTQINHLVSYIDYNWETCDGFEVQEFGCTAGQKFAKREPFDAALDASDETKHHKIMGLAALIVQLEKFSTK